MQKFKQFAGFLSAVLTVTSSAFAAEYFVPDGTGDTFVTQLKNAFTKCVDDNGDIVTLAAGTYDMSDATAAVNPGKKGVTLRGDPSVTREQVIIKGGSKYCGFTSTTRKFALENLTFQEFTYPATGNSPGTVVKGAKAADGTMYVTLSNCVVWACSTDEGGTVYGADLFDCVFSNNYARVYGAAAGDVTARNCLFANNTSGRAGTILNAFELDHCVFVGNQGGAGYSGGAIRLKDATIKGVYRDCYFTNNTCGGGGAIYRGTATNCVFYGNTGTSTSSTAGNYGGATSLVDAYKCEYTANTAIMGAGAAYDGKLEYCTFTANTNGASDHQERGGAIKLGSAFSCDFYNNVSHGYGGAADSPTLVSNCVFVGNVALNTRGGGAIYSSVDTIAMQCAFTNNEAGINGGAMSGGTAIGCTFGVNRIRSDTSSSQGQYCYGVTAKGCVFDGENASELSGLCDYGACWRGSYENCVFKNFDGVRNIIRSDADIISVRGCLFCDNEPTTSCVRGSKSVSALNCTFANNAMGSGGVLVYAGGSNTATVDNSIFVNNSKNGKRADCTVSAGTKTGAHNCYIEQDATYPFPLTGEDNFQVDKVNFVGAGEHPYQLAYKQRDARIKTGGAVGDWTADDKDLAGNPRLHGEGAAATIGLGCYECWTMPKGLMLLLR